MARQGRQLNQIITLVMYTLAAALPHDFFWNVENFTSRRVLEDLWSLQQSIVQSALFDLDDICELEKLALVKLGRGTERPKLSDCKSACKAIVTFTAHYDIRDGATSVTGKTWQQHSESAKDPTDVIRKRMDEFMSRALHVDISADDVKKIDFSVAPSSGEEYLKRVMIEARRCEEVVVATIDSGRLKAQTVKYTAETGCTPAPDGFMSSLDWQTQQVADFSNTRQQMTRYLLRQKQKGIKPKPPLPLPGIDDDEGWIRFSFGSERSNTEACTSELESTGTEPLLSIISALNQPLVEAVLEYHVQWMEVHSFSELQGKWLYALLVRLEKPLTPEMCSLLRTLARLCAKHRASLESPNDPMLPQLNLFICLVSRYFGQMDLADT